MRARKCNCKYWEPNVKLILYSLEHSDAVIQSDIFNSHKIAWFEFCPWCGEKLIEDGPELPSVYLDDNFMPRKMG